MTGSMLCRLGFVALVAAGCSSGNGKTESKCGNSEIDQFEECDGQNLNGLTCEDLDFASGALACSAECRFDTGGCVTLCGNGQLDPSEACDGDDLNGKECTDLGYDTGTLSCDPDCSFDTSLCEDLQLCGNQLVDAGEDCDGAELGGQTCLDLGFTGGELLCDGNCLYDTSNCQGGQPCGNGQLDAGEECDGTELNQTACTDLGFAGGELACDDGCRFDLSGCFNLCGNAGIDEGEDCDGDNLNGLTCLDLGYAGGQLACLADCLFDTAACQGDDPCGNSEIDYGEECDAGNLDGASCESLGYFTGTLGCLPDCRFELSQCSNCGNGTIEAGEACDGADLGGLECADLGYSDGDLECAAQCLFEVSGCSGCADDQYEENDDQASAAPLLTGSHQLVMCNEAGAESDWYSMELLAGSALALVARFDPALLDLDLELRALDGELLDSSTTTSDREEMLYLAADPQTVFLRVYPYEDQPGVTAYSLAVLLDPPCLAHADCPAGQLCEDYVCIDFVCDQHNPCPDDLVCGNGECVQCRSSADCPSPAYFRCQDNICEFSCAEDIFEPNDSSSSPAIVGVDFAEVALTLCGEREEDWYQVELLEDHQYSFDFTFLHADGDIDVQLFRASDPADEIASGLSTSDNESFDYVVPEAGAGSHLIRVWLVSEGVYGQSYDMSVIQEAQPECLEDQDCLADEICIEGSCIQVAPGDTCGAAIPVESFPFSVSAVDITQFSPQLELDSNACTSFNTAGRDVVYRMNLAAGAQLQASLTSTFDGALYLVSDCSVVPIPSATACLAGADAAGQNGTETVQYTAQAAGTFYLVVDHYAAGGPASGSYSLDLTLQ